jgi:phenylalanyl-tRNA synthetase beta chain
MRLRRADVVADPLVCRGTPLALRQSVAAGLLESLHINRNVRTDARLFEIAKRFVPIEGRDLPQEDAMLALASGDEFHAVRGALETLFDALHIGRRIRFAATDRYPDLAPGMAAEIFLSERSEDPSGEADPIGMIGIITDATAKAFDLDDPATVAEILYAPLVEAADLVPAYEPLPQFPAIARDLAIVVAETVTWARIEQAVAAARAETLESLQPLDVYRGPQVPAGKKSVALRLILRSKAETLKGEQADEAQAKILQALQSAVGAVLRS